MADSSDDILNQLKGSLGGAATGTSVPHYIGVPNDYSVNRRSMQSDVFDQQVGPQYLDGDQHQPASWAPDDMASLQRKLFQSGLLDNSFRPGVWDDTSDSAYEVLLGMANRSGKDADSLLSELLQNRVPTKGSSAKIAAPDPNQVRLQAAPAIQSVLGRVDPQLVESISNDYSQTSIARQQAAANSTGGVVADVPDVSSFAQGEARLRNPTEAGANDYLNQFQNFMKVIGFDPRSGGPQVVQ